MSVLLPPPMYPDASNALLPNARTSLGTDWIIPVPTAKGDGATDDTTVLQTALNSLTAGQVIGLRAGGVYCVHGLSIPNVSGIGFVALGGTATLQANSGSPTYLVANANWITNVAFAAAPTFFQNIVFHGNSLVQVAQYDIGFQSKFINCEWKGALAQGHYVRGTTQNGTALGNTTENNQYSFCRWDSNGGDGFYSDGHHTDAQICGGYLNNNGGYGLDSLSVAGWLIQQVHTYSNTSGGALLGKLGASGVQNNIFEDAVNLFSVDPTYKEAIVGPNNTFLSLVTATFNDNTAYESLVSLNNIYGSSAQLKQNYNGVQHLLISRGDRFASNSPFMWNGGSGSNGRIFADHCDGYGAIVSLTNGEAYWNGIQYPSINAPQAPNVFEDWKYLSNSGTTTTWAATIVMTSSASHAGFNQRLRLDVWSLNSTSTAIEQYSASFLAIYKAPTGALASVSSCVALDTHSTGSNVSASCAFSGETTGSGNTTITLTVTITHPQAPDQFSSGSMLHVESVNREVRSIVLT
jgi:hypothetical protein